MNYCIMEAPGTFAVTCIYICFLFIFMILCETFILLWAILVLLVFHKIMSLIQLHRSAFEKMHRHTSNGSFSNKFRILISEIIKISLLFRYFCSFVLKIAEINFSWEFHWIPLMENMLNINKKNYIFVKVFWNAFK